MTPPRPRSKYVRPNYGHHGQSLLSQAVTAIASVSKKKDIELVEEAAFFVFTAHDAKIKEHRSKLRRAGIDVVSIDPSDDTKGTAIVTKAYFETLTSKISEYAYSEDNTGKSYFSPIERIEVIDPISKIEPSLLENDTNSCIIYLYQSLSTSEQNKVLQSISVSLEDYEERRSKFVRTSVSGFALAAVLRRDEMMRLAQEYNSVRLIRKNGTFKLQKSSTGPSISPSVACLPPLTNIKVGVVDSGVTDTHSFITPYIADRHSIVPHGSGLDTSHGTFVASRIIFGDNINDQVANGFLLPVCHVVDMPIFWISKSGTENVLDETDIIDLLTTYIPANPDVRIYNLSIGNDEPISDFYVSPLAMELDHLSKQHNVLFIIASGNVSHLSPHSYDDYPQIFSEPEYRINAPAESLLGITVGSYASVQHGSDIAPPNHISPFSRVGPGMDGNTKPDLVAVGGNCYTFAGHHYSSPQSSACGLNNDGKYLAFDVGTSYAAPIVSHYAAQVLYSEPQMTGNMLKCHMIHYATRSGLPQNIGDRPDSIYGFGEFQFGDLIAKDIDKMVFVYEGELSAGRYHHIPFHIPSSMDSSNGRRLTLKITIVHDPDVDDGNTREYSLSDIGLTLFKNQSGNLVQIAESGGGNYKHSEKYSPVLKYKRTFTRNFSAGLWEARLRLTTRGKLDSKYRQSFAIIIECIDESGSIDFYKDFIGEFGKGYAISIPRAGQVV